MLFAAFTLAYLTVAQPPMERLFYTHQRLTRPYGIRTKDFLLEMKLANFNVLHRGWDRVPPWLLQMPRIILDLASFRKEQTSDFTYQLFLTVLDRHHDVTVLYTDGSKHGDSVRCSIMFPDCVIKIRLPGRTPFRLDGTRAVTSCSRQTISSLL